MGGLRIIHDRYEPMSREDYLCAGRSVREAREISDRLLREEALRQQEHEDDLAHAKERRAALEHNPEITAGSNGEVFTDGTSGMN